MYNQWELKIELLNGSPEMYIDHGCFMHLWGLKYALLNRRQGMHRIKGVAT